MPRSGVEKGKIKALHLGPFHPVPHMQAEEAGGLALIDLQHRNNSRRVGGQLRDKSNHALIRG